MDTKQAAVAQTPPLKHLAIIMDGNRRWARAKGLGAINGHEHVVNNVMEPIVDRCIELGIPYLTMWAFSTENWDRDKVELEGLMRLFRHAFDKRVEDLHKKGVRLQVLGEIDRFPKDVAQKSREWIEISKNNTKITVSFALNYGGRDEILRAIKRLLADVQSGKLNASNLKITEQLFSQYLDTANMPDPDLVIRAGGELRLSGFLTWQSVYSELYFTSTLMPDFTVADLDKAIEEYSRRKRRFGK
jgi:undecaprenyl diphosphate synthase